MSCTFFFTVKTSSRLCALSEGSTCSTSSLSASSFAKVTTESTRVCCTEAPYILHALPSQTVLDFLLQQRNKPFFLVFDPL